MKRFLDVVFSFMALVVLAPFLLPVVVILRFTGEGEVFYIQERAGRGSKSFGLYKFATMLKNSPNIGACEITVRGDPRVLPFGQFLRKTKLNELPQFCWVDAACCHQARGPLVTPPMNVIAQSKLCSTNL